MVASILRTLLHLQRLLCRIARCTKKRMSMESLNEKTTHGNDMHRETVDALDGFQRLVTSSSVVKSNDARRRV